MPKQFELLILKMNLSRNKSLIVAACYRPPSAPSCALDTICELIAPHLSSEFVLLGDLKWDMINTLIDIILTNLPSKYISAVFNQDLSSVIGPWSNNHRSSLSNAP